MRNKTRLAKCFGGGRGTCRNQGQSAYLGTDVMGSQGAKQAVVEHKEPRVLLGT